MSDIDVTDRNLAGLIFSIRRAPECWRGWSCLSFETDGKIDEAFLSAARLFSDSYLRDMERYMFTGSTAKLYIFCRHASKVILNELGMQLSNLAMENNDASVYFKAYELAFDMDEFLKDFSGNIGETVVLDNGERLDLLQPEPVDLTNRNVSPVGAVKVLLVEDDPVTRWMVRSALKNECRLATAPSANKAFAMVENFKPDVIFLDINLPDKNGHAVLDWVMHNDPGACVVMFSSQGDMANIATALDDGAKGFVAKPFLKENLLYYIRQHERAA
jgi:two-component system chemotaxis response regulator CheY